MTVISFGSLNHQIDMLFKIYDYNLSGTLSFDEIQEMCKRQLQSGKDDQISNYLSECFANIIFKDPNEITVMVFKNSSQSKYPLLSMSMVAISFSIKPSALIDPFLRYCIKVLLLMPSFVL